MGTYHNAKCRWKITPLLSRGDVRWKKILAIDNRLSSTPIIREGIVKIL